MKRIELLLSSGCSHRERMSKNSGKRKMIYRDLTNMDEKEMIDYGNVLSQELSKDYVWNNEKLWKIYNKELRRIHQALGGH